MVAPTNRFARVALILVLLVYAVRAERTESWRRLHLQDFHVYETAALLIHQHRDLDIYNGADTGVDPQTRLADPDSAFAKTALARGRGEILMYLYPPLLADLVVPLTLVSPAAADAIWSILNGLFLLCSMAYLWAMLRPDASRWGGAAVFASLLCCYPTFQCMLWGNIPLLLLLLWTSGILLYGRGRLTASAVIFAFATLLKLTPLIVVVPMLLWRDWKWMRVYGVALLVGVGGMAIVNTPACVADFFFHVMPAMSHGDGSVAFTNKSLMGALNSCYVMVTLGRRAEGVEYVPRALALLGRGLSLLAVVGAGYAVGRGEKRPMAPDRMLVLSCFAALSVVVSPVSWPHSYLLFAPVLCLVWGRALGGGWARSTVVSLALCTIELGCFLFSSLLYRSLPAEINLSALVSPLAGLGFVLLLLFRRRSLGDLSRDSVGVVFDEAGGLNTADW